MPNPRVLGLIPARSGSKRIIGKNIRPLMGHPLMAFSIASAIESGVFEKVVVSTDLGSYGTIAQHYGADILYRPPEMSSDTSPDIEFVEHALKVLSGFDAFAILRPTSPFRQAATIRRAWRQFLDANCHSLRAVEKCHEHPAKQWTVSNGYLHPLLPLVTGATGAPGHSSQYPTLPAVYVQNASLEIAWASTAERYHSIAGEVISAFLTYDAEGFDVNFAYDFEIAEMMVARGEATLPEIKVPVFAGA